MLINTSIAILRYLYKTASEEEGRYQRDEIWKSVFAILGYIVRLYQRTMRRITMIYQ